MITNRFTYGGLIYFTWGIYGVSLIYDIIW